MNFFRQIAACLSIALLAFANMGAQMDARVQTTPPTAHHKDSRLTIAPGDQTLYCITGNQCRAGVGHGYSATTLKVPVALGTLKNAFLDGHRVSGFNYFILTKYLLVGFPTTDAIYPFHQFW